MKRALLAATAILSSSLTPLAFPTPAFADVVDPDVQAALNQYCAVSVVPPGDNSPLFVITAINVIAGATTPGGDTTITLIAGTEHRHGGSPNIFEDAHVTTSGGSTTYTFDCQTYNPASGNYPPGLQFTGIVTSIENSSGSSTDTDVVVCNSPTKRPGVWRAQNSYAGDCAAEGAIFYTLPIYSAQSVWNPIPSNSLPQ
jgi:hypothetical protein